MSNFEIVAAVVIAVLSVARTSRLLTYDAYPPVVWFRMKWDAKIGREGWGSLIHCQYCATPYMMIVMALWFYFGGDHWTWWWINGVWGFSYLSAITVSYDQPE